MNSSITDVCPFCAFMVFFSLFEGSYSDLVKSRAFQKREIRAFSFQNLSHTHLGTHTHTDYILFIKNFIFFQTISYCILKRKLNIVYGVIQIIKCLL